MCAHEATGQCSVSSSLTLLFLMLETVFSLYMALAILTRLTGPDDPWVFCCHLPLFQALGLQMYAPCSEFTWVLVIQTQALLVHTALSPPSRLPTFLNFQEVLVSVFCRKAEPHTGVWTLLHRQVCQRREPVGAFVYRSVLGARKLLENNLLSELVIAR